MPRYMRNTYRFRRRGMAITIMVVLLLIFLMLHNDFLFTLLTVAFYLWILINYPDLLYEFEEMNNAEVQQEDN